MLIFWTPFNTGRFTSERETASWTDFRFRLWQRFTAPSIQAQTRAHRYVLLCDHDLRHLTEPWRLRVEAAGAELVYDERAWRAALPRVDEIVTLRVDSDDVYHREAGSEAVHVLRMGGFEFVRFSRGYAVNLQVGRQGAWTWNHAASPFVAHLFDGVRFRGMTKWEEPGHRQIHGEGVINTRRWVVIGHGQNSSTMAMRNKGEHPVTPREVHRDFPEMRGVAW